MSPAPRILIFLLSGHWMGISRLPKALVQAGFQVATLSPPDSYLSQTRFAQRHVTLPPNAHPVEFLVRVLAEAKPDLIIPGCDTTVMFLQQFEKAYRSNANPNVVALLELVRRSLGDPAFYPVTTSKNRLVETARAAGIRTPDYTEVSTSHEALRFAEKHRYPIVLKAEHGTGGTGVRVCNNPREIAMGLQELQTMAPPLPTTPPQHSKVVAQQFIRGIPAMQVFCAMGGKILEQMQTLKQERHPGPTGPSSVVRFFDHPEMDASARTLIAKLGFSGVAGIDFMIEDATQHAYLIELNPRPCPISHLGHFVGRDLARALWCHVTNTPYTREKVANPPEAIALFPQELQRDPQSPALTTMLHDIPQDDPELLQALME